MKYPLCLLLLLIISVLINFLKVLQYYGEVVNCSRERSVHHSHTYYDGIIIPK